MLICKNPRLNPGVALRKPKAKSRGSVTKTQGYAGKQGADLLLLGHGACSFVEILREIYTPIFLMPHSRTELPPVRRAGPHSVCVAAWHRGGLFPAAALQNCGSGSGGFKAFRRFPVFGKPTPRQSATHSLRSGLWLYLLLYPGLMPWAKSWRP